MPRRISRESDLTLMAEYEIYGKEWCRRRRLPTIHILHMLRDRELNNRKAGTQFFYGGRQFYQCIFPSKSVTNVDKGSFTIKRFTPDGRLLICFSSNYHSVIIHRYKGVCAAANKSPSQMFESVFQLVFSLNVVSGLDEGTSLFKDCAFVTSDSRHLIVGTECPLGECVPTLSEIFRNNESLQPSTSQLYNINFYSIDLQKGTVCDQYTLSVDRVVVSHGVHLVGRLFAVLSLQQQTIHMLHIDEASGRFILLSHVGRLLYDDDDIVLSAVPQETPFSVYEQVHSGLKQRLMSYLYHRCLRNGTVDQFLHTFSHFRSLRIWQLQLVTSDIILLRFVHMDAFGSSSTVSSQPALFVFYDWRHTEILNVFDRYSAAFLTVLENCQEELKHPEILFNRFPCTMQHCQQALFQYRRLKRAQCGPSSQEGSLQETQRRILSQLPYLTTYAPMETPYLDPSMFSYDDKLLALAERMKIPSRETYRFFSRVTSTPLFDLTVSSGRYVQLLFHPTEPLAISVDRARHSNSITFHIPNFVSPNDSV
ncbi:hypothetical protein AB6A40_002689 [Gnathostoma spinigerum]|uniref:DET1 homolog n=1 Tax=Gnathostoma spinigerum TaxID=75299 RepID=A0ABD6E7A0_9BILA